ncbi:acyltransferase [Collinsella sp. AF38-3AC]|uniref:acyltransferase n=1 Tax=Collinsella sp. AF38-3AC TaxID=2292015 RepID=UPI000E4B1145|nr:acyltransferase [Collinsella sp. AF38-3AC]RHL21613.1 acyltransferase [Collinsella sp. AF38-3AC]
MGKRRFVYFDMLSIVATLAVVFLHCNGIVHWGPQTPHWSQALLVEVLFYWAVPVFFMCSGAKTMGYRDRKSTKDFLVSRLKGIFFPFLVWSVFQYCIKVWGVLNPVPEGWAPSLGHFLTVFMNVQIDGTYWFFFAMLAVVLSMPVLSRLRDFTGTLWYLVGGYVMLSGVVVPAAKLLGIPWNGSIGLAVAGGYVMYTVLGYLLANDDSGIFERSKNRCVLYAAAAVALFVRYAYTWVSSQGKGVVDTALFDYNYITALLPSVAVFVWFKTVDWGRLFERLHIGTGFIQQVSSCTFGVYLMHNFLLSEVFVGLLSWDMVSYRVRLVLPWIIFLLGLGVSYVLNRVPAVRNAVGGWR